MPPASLQRVSADPVLYVCGDVHFDGADLAFATWLDGLAARSPARLVILGDLVEWWIDDGASCARHEPVLSRLRRLRALGWNLAVVRGNREIAAGRAFEVAAGARLHWPHLDLALGQVRLRIVHGDRLVHDPRYRAWSVWTRGFAFAWALRLVPTRIQEAVTVWMRGKSRGHRPMAVNRIFIDPRRVRAAARAADVLLAGHVHQSWRRRVGGVDLILVGHWPAGRGHWVEGYADGRLERRSAPATATIG